MEIVCTICSRVKSEEEGLLPARKRYLGEHIQSTYEIAEKEGKPYFILSSVYGLISGDTEIPNYDHRLEESEVDDLTTKVADQIRDLGITAIDFYYEEKATWEPYKRAFSKAAENANAQLVICPMQ